MNPIYHIRRLHKGLKGKGVSRVRSNFNLCLGVWSESRHSGPPKFPRLIHLHSDPDAKAVAEKSLGCRLRARLLQSGDCVLFCLPFAMGDQVAVDKGIKFLKDWERKDSSERNNGRLLDFLQVSKDFFDPACVVDSGLHSHQLLINGRAIRLSRKLVPSPPLTWIYVDQSSPSSCRNL